ncbi:response regulator [Opitutaceae bacterium]|nr:response regulator [Opitutaceae bacterium]
MPSVLIVDDLLSIHEMLEAVIQPTGYATSFATDGQAGLARYKEEKFDIVLADIDMKPVDGITLLKQLKEYDASAVVIIMTAYASTESAIQALKFGAFDYLQKPFRVDELLGTLKRAIEYRGFQDKRAQSSAVTVETADLESRLIGSSAVMAKLKTQVKKLAGAHTPVLLQGEPGTGRSAVAEILHESASESDGELVRIDCSLSSDDNFAAGLLGESGTGGAWVEKAVNGTLLLEKLETLPQEMQSKLVSVLRNSAHKFRLVCTTSSDLEEMTDDGRFDDELFYRVASLPVTLPRLQAYLSDLPEIIKSILSKCTNPHFDAKLIEFTPDALKAMNEYIWPGNVMELQQVVTQIGTSSESRMVGADQLPDKLKSVGDWATLDAYLSQMRRSYVAKVMRACRNDRSQAAKVLGITESELD